MATETITCIALPNGLTPDGRGRLSLLLLPALHPAGDTSALDDFDFQAWPSLLAETSWRVHAGAITRDIVPERLPNSPSWPVLFPPGLLVRKPAPERLSPVFTTYPADRMADLVRRHRGQSLVHGAGHALDALEDAANLDGGQLEDRLLADVLLRADAGAMRQLIQGAEDQARARRAAGGEDFSATGRDRGDLASALSLFAAFHQQPAHSEQQTAAIAAADAAAPDTRLDLHQRISLLLQYPAILRELGLLLDFVLPLDGIEDETDLSVEMRPPEATALTAAIPPATRVDRASFRAVPRDGSPGFADLARFGADGLPRYAITGFDVDAAGHELLQLLRAPGPRAEADAQLQVRSIGLGLLERGRAANLYAAAERTAALLARRAQAPNTPLAADDLVAGHRVDILEERNGRWSSLHARHGEYLVDGQAPLDALDEGVLTPALSQPERSAGDVAAAAHDQTQRSMLAEALLVWNGWSLSTPTPTVPMAGTPHSGPAPLPLQVIWSTPAGSLPRLRFGARYRVRLRTVDLAGGGISLAEADAAMPASALLPPADAPAWPFLRAEPLGAPLLQNRTPGRAATALDQPLVLLRDAGASSGNSEVALQVPLASRVLSEWSGMFDAAFGPGGDPAALMALAETEALADPWVAALAIADCPGVPDQQLCRITAGGVSFEALPANLSRPVRALLLVDVPAAPAWPQLAGFSIRLADGAAGPTWDATSRVLTVHLPAGHSQLVSISAVPLAERLPHFAAFDWAREQVEHEMAAGSMDDTLAAAALAKLERSAALGLLPDVSAPGTLTLVHALRLPAAPVIAALPPPVRAEAELDVALAGRIEFDAASTGRIRLSAHWREPVGLPSAGEAAPQLHAEILEVPANASAADLPAGVALTAGVLTLTGRTDPVALRERIADALGPLHVALRKLERLALDAGMGNLHFDFNMNKAAAAMAMPPDAHAFTLVKTEIGIVGTLADNMLDDDGEPDDGQSPVPRPVQDAARKVVGIAANVAATCGTVIGLLGQPHLRQHFSDGRHRMVDYTASAQTRFIDFYPGDEAAARGTDSQSVRVSIPASVRPLPPRVADAVPVFRWTREGSAPDERSSTRACGFRIYLEAPWFSSGEGELLAILLRLPGEAPAGDRLPFISRWARDPAFHGPIPSAEPSRLHLRGEAPLLATLVVPGERGHHVDAAGLALQADAAGRLFADIYFDPGVVYSPFIQLAAARWQPSSLPGLELSEPVILDPLPLLPPRTLTATTEAGGLTLRLRGPTHATEGRPNLFRATFQRRLPGTTGDAAWQAVPDGAALELLATSDDVLWSARVSAIAPGGDFRLQVEEYERYFSTSEDPQAALRLVYAEHVRL